MGNTVFDLRRGDRGDHAAFVDVAVHKFKHKDERSFLCRNVRDALRIYLRQIYGGRIVLVQDDLLLWEGMAFLGEDRIGQCRFRDRDGELLFGFHFGDPIAVLRFDVVCGRLQGIGQKAYRHGDACNDGEQDEPKGGLFVVQHVLHTRFHADLAEGERAGGDHPAGDTAREQCLGIIRARLGAELRDHALVAGELDVAAEQDVRYPQNGIEPVDGQQQKSNRLDKVVASRKVRFFMRDDVRRVLLRYAKRQVDLRAHHAEDERGCRVFALIDVVPQAHRCPHASAQAQIADGGIEQHCRDADKPQHRIHRDPDLERVGTGKLGGGKALGDDGVDHAVYRGNTAVDRGRRVEHDRGADRLGTRDEAERAFDGKRAEQPQSHDAPQHNMQPFRRFFQQQAQKEHREHEPARRNAHVEDLDKEVSHLCPPFCSGRSSSAPRRSRARRSFGAL